MRSIAEIDRDFAGMGKRCENRNHGCYYPQCECSREGAIPIPKQCEHGIPGKDCPLCSLDEESSMAELPEGSQQALVKIRHALTAPLDDWKGEVERAALDALPVLESALAASPAPELLTDAEMLPLPETQYRNWDADGVLIQTFTGEQMRDFARANRAAQAAKGRTP